jgi:hypothetical protein
MDSTAMLYALVMSHGNHFSVYNQSSANWDSTRCSAFFRFAERVLVVLFVVHFGP